MKEPKSHFSGAFFDTLLLSHYRKPALMTSEVKEAQTPLEDFKSGLRKNRNVFVWRYLEALVGNTHLFLEISPKHSNFINFAVSVRTDLVLRCAGRSAPTHYVLGAISGSSFLSVS